MATMEATLLERGLPANLDAERSILGAILLENLAHMEAAEVISGSDFSLESHQRIFRMMSEMLEIGRAVDIVTLGEELSRYRQIESVGGWAYLASLTEGLPRRISIDEYVRIVKEKSMLRQMIAACTNAIAEANEQRDIALDIMGRAEERILEIGADVQQGTIVSALEMLPRTLARLDSQNSTAERIIPTGLPGLDDATGGGIRTKELWIFGALPARGKTSIVRQIALSAAKGLVPTLVDTLEMSGDQWFELTISGEADIDAFRLRKQSLLNTIDRERMKSYGQQLSVLPLYFDETAPLDLSTLLRRAKLASMRHGMKLLIVDYIQLVQTPARDRRTAVGEVGMALKNFAKTHDVAIIACSQLARPDRKNLNARPTMLDLKESGDLEAHSHTVILNYRPVDEKNAFTGKDELILGKQRNGPPCSVPTRYNTKTLRFEDRQKSEDEE